MDSTHQVDVLVIGAGPTGSTLALDLARRGHAVRLVDRSLTAFDGSRAKGIQPRTLEVFDDLGVLPQIVDDGDLYPLMGIHLGPVTMPLRMIKNSDATDAIPHPNTWLIPQNKTIRALHERLGAAGVHIEGGSESRSIRQLDDGVEVVVDRGGVESVVHARYVVGADGGSSAVRRSQGISFDGTTDEADRMIIADLETSGLSRRRWHIWPAVGGRFTGACPLPHTETFQWMIRLRDSDEPVLDRDSIVRLIHDRVGERKISLGAMSWSSLFRPNIRLAAQYRRGRVLIAGDAAHVHPPAGAQGLNTGVQDAYNLGWKLSQVLAGAPDALLDTYEAERRPIAAAVLGLSSAKYQGIGTLDRKAAKRGDDEKQLTLTYSGGPLSFSDESTSTLGVGDRAPDARLSRVDGSPVRLFDLVRGGCFTLLTFGDAGLGLLKDVSWPTGGAELRVVAVRSGPVADVRGVTSVVDSHGSFQKIYGTSGDTVFLLRPDGYIAAIATGDVASVVERARQRMTGDGNMSAIVSGDSRR